MAETFAQPARQCLLPGLVPRAYLPGAVALNSLTYNVARFIGPALSGPMIAAWGVVPPIACNGAAFLFASLTMYLLRLDPAIRLGHRSTHSVLHDAIEGIRYVARHRGIGPLMLFAAAVGMMLRAVPEMLPPYVADLFGRDARGLATLASTMGLAALVGGTLVAIRGRLGGLTRIAVYAGLVLALATACFVATHHFAVGVVCIAVMGAATTMHGISIQTLLQNSASSVDGGPRAEPVGHDHPCRPGDGRAHLWRGLGVPRAADRRCCWAACSARWRGCARRSRLPRIAPALEGSETLA